MPAITTPSIISATMAANAISRCRRTATYTVATTRKTSMASSMRLVMEEPQDSDTVDEPMASGLALPFSSLTWNFSKMAARAAPTCSWDRRSEVTSRVSEEPAPTIWTSSGSTPVASVKVSSTCSVERSPAGMFSLVPPSKSRERLKPRMRMAAMAAMTSTAVMVYHVLDLPMKL